MENNDINELIKECIKLLDGPRYYKKNEINKIKDILNKCLNINIKVEKNNIIQNKIKKQTYTEDNLSIEIIILDIKLKYKYFKNDISNFILNNIDIKKKDKYKIMEDIFRILYKELYIEYDSNNKIIFEIILSKVKYSDAEDFNVVKSRLENLINKANDFYIYIKNICEKNKLKILFEYFPETNMYIRDKMYTEDLSEPQDIITCICPAIFYLYENNNENEYKLLEKALIISDDVKNNINKILKMK